MANSKVPRRSRNLRRNKLGQGFDSRGQDQTPRYKIVSLSLYRTQAESVDQATESLRAAGFLNVSRSFVMQSLVERILQGKTPEEIVAFFDQYPLRKPTHRAGPRSRRLKLDTG